MIKLIQIRRTFRRCVYFVGKKEENYNANMATHMDPFNHETEFVGREEFIEGLDRAWRGNTRIFGIFGLRSVGKTRTAFEFIRRKMREIHENEQTADTGIEEHVSINPTETEHVSEEHNTGASASPFNTEDRGLSDMTTELNKLKIRDRGKNEPLKVFYVNLHQFKDLGSISSQLFAQLGMHSKIRSVNDFVFKLVNAIKTLPSSINVLLLDNAEDAIEGRLDYSLQDISARLIQSCSSVRIILTATTNAKFAQVGKVYKVFELLPMSEVDASKFLRKLAPSVDYKDTFERIVSLCAGLPLAIMLVAAELLTGTSSDKMVTMLGECRIEALSKEGNPDERRVGKQMSGRTTKPTKRHVRPAKTQISLGIHPVWSVFVVRMNKAWVLSYQLGAQRRL